MSKKVEEKKQEPIDLREKVEVFSTDKDPHHETGSVFKVHPKLADSLVERGLATKEAPKEGKKKAEDSK